MWDRDGYDSEPNSSHCDSNKKHSHRYYYNNPHDGYDSDISYNGYKYSDKSDRRRYSDRSDYSSVSDCSRFSNRSTLSDCPKSSDCSKFSECPKSSKFSSKCSSKCDDSHRNDHGSKFYDDCDDCDNYDNYDDYNDYGVLTHRVYKRYNYKQDHYEGPHHSNPLYLQNNHYNYHPLRKLQPFYKCQKPHKKQSYGGNDVQKSNESYDDYCRRYYAQH